MQYTGIVADGFDDAIVGLTKDDDNSTVTVVYSIERCVETLMTRDGMTSEEAIEFFDFNVLGAYIQNGPKFIWTLDDLDP